jgi:branched-chain amino acid transport system ATP-binding protein
VILRLDNLTRSFGSLKAVDGVDLEVAPGEALGIIGPNGAGKLFNLITGLLRPDAGSVWFDGRDITQAPPRARCIAGIGRSFQIPHPFENLTVFENLLVAASARQFCGDLSGTNHGKVGPEQRGGPACRRHPQVTGLGKI